MTLQEVMDTCKNWEQFCDAKGFSYWAVNEGGGNVDVRLSTQEAHEFGIVTLPDWKVEKLQKGGDMNGWT